MTVKSLKQNDKTERVESEEIKSRISYLTLKCIYNIFLIIVFINYYYKIIIKLLRG